jgi:hypothetical protein
MAATCRHTPDRPFGHYRLGPKSNINLTSMSVRAGDGAFSRASRPAKKPSAFVRVGLWQKKFNSHSFCVEPSLADGYGYLYKYFPKKS